MLVSIVFIIFNLILPLMLEWAEFFFQDTQEAISPSVHHHIRPNKTATPHILVCTENHCAVD